MSEFIPRIIQKAQELLPNVQESDLMSFLLNSRAISAYDSVMLVASSVNISSKQQQAVDPVSISTY